VEHVRWNSRYRIPDTGLQVIKSSVGGKKKLPEFHCNLPQTACGKKSFQSFTVICRKPRVASSICWSATIFQNPKGLCGHTVLGATVQN
jgi:hypothetical protein